MSSSPAPAPIEGTVPDFLPADEHFRLDKEICREFDWDSSLHSIAFLLATIIKLTPQLDQAYKDAAAALQLVKASPDLQHMMRDAWTRKSFRDIRLLKILQAPPRIPMWGFLSFRPLWALERAAEDAWLKDYKGSSAELLADAIDKLYKTADPYPRILPVVQSSGTGKSRTMDQVAKTRVTFPLCLRENPGAGSFTYPRPDVVVRQYLTLQRPSTPPLSAEEAEQIQETKIVPQSTQRKMLHSLRRIKRDYAYQYEVKHRLRCFFTALFSKGCDLIEQLCTHCPQTPPESLAQIFYTHFQSESKRVAFYFQVIEKAEQYGSEIPTFEVEFHRFLSMSKQHTSDLAHQCAVVVYIDELDALFTETVGPRTILDELGSVLRNLSGSKFIVVCLSTSSKISPAPAEIGSSIPQPFTLLNFDTFVTKVVENTLELCDVTDFDLVASFGRPLWFSLYDALRQRNDSRRSAREVRDIAEDMLVVQVQSSGLLSSDAAIAILSIRLLLDIEPNCSQNRDLEERLVAEHMRIAFAIPSHREYMHSGAPSEPILAEAAAKLMNSPDLWAQPRKVLATNYWGMGPSGGCANSVRSGGREKAIALPTEHTVMDEDTEGSESDYKTLEPPHFSEPIWVPAPKDQSPYMDKLLEYFQNGFAPKGEERTFFVGRLLDILAIDAAMKDISRKPYTDQESTILKWGTPIPVLKYLEHLLGKKNLEQIKATLPVNPIDIDPIFQNLTLEKAFANAFVHFNHYQRAADHSVLQAEWLWAYWARGVAFQLQPGQTLSDRAIPIFWTTLAGTGITPHESVIHREGTTLQDNTKPQDEPPSAGKPKSLRLGRHSCSAILHQDKNSPILFNPIKLQKPQQLTMFDGVAPKPVLAFNHVYGSSVRKIRSNTMPYDQSILAQPKNYDAPLYEISILGLHENNYEPIKISKKQKIFSDLLADRSVYDDLDSIDQASLNGLHRLLPAHRKVTTHWVSSAER